MLPLANIIDNSIVSTIARIVVQKLNVVICHTKFGLNKLFYEKSRPSVRACVIECVRASVRWSVRPCVRACVRACVNASVRRPIFKGHLNETPDPVDSRRWFFDLYVF